MKNTHNRVFQVFNLIRHLNTPPGKTVKQLERILLFAYTLLEVVLVNDFLNDLFLVRQDVLENCPDGGIIDVLLPNQFG